MGLKRAELSLTLAGPQRTRALNLAYRGVDRDTDVLSFPLYSSPAEFPQDGDFILGDIVINPSRAEEQARSLGHSLHAELRRLMVHGLLHLLGYDHEHSAYKASKMRAKEEEILKSLD